MSLDKQVFKIDVGYRFKNVPGWTFSLRGQLWRHLLMTLYLLIFVVLSIPLSWVFFFLKSS